jgi:hypothetical protein
MTSPVTYTIPGTYEYQVPQGVNAIACVVKGASGGISSSPFQTPTAPHGQVVNYTMNVTPGDNLQINVGGRGASQFAGGYNGGGNGGLRSSSTNPFDGSGAGGGGASDIRFNNNIIGFPLSSRIIVAGGGGGYGGSESLTVPNGSAGASVSVNGNGRDGTSASSVFPSLSSGGGKGATKFFGGAGGVGSAYYASIGVPDPSLNGSPGGIGSLGNGGNGGTAPVSPGTNTTLGGGGGGGGGGYYGGGAGGSGNISGSTNSTLGGSPGAGGGSGSSLIPPNGTSSVDTRGLSDGSVTLTFAVPKVTPTITNFASNIFQNQIVTLNATISNGSNPTGFLNFIISTSPCSTNVGGSPNIPVNGNGTYSYSNVPSYLTAVARTYYFFASYQGDSLNNPVTTCDGGNIGTFTVFPATNIALSVPPSSIVVDNSTTVTATLSNLASSPATGTVTFSAYGPSTCSGPLVFSQSVQLQTTDNNQISSQVSFPNAGTYYLVASYVDDTGLNSSATTICDDSLTSVTSVNVTQATPTLTLSLSQFVPLGNGGSGVPVGSLVKPRVLPTIITIGDSCNIFATLANGSNNIASQIIFTAYTTDDCSGNPSYTSNPTDVFGNGIYNASPPFTPTIAGDYYIVASYIGDNNNSPVSTACNGSKLSVSKADSSITMSFSPPQTSVFVNQQSSEISAGISGSIDYILGQGTVSLSIYDQADCANLIYTDPNTIPFVGDATYSFGGYKFGTPGNYYFVVSYSGDDNNNESSSGCNDLVLTVDPYTPSITTSVSPSSIVLGNSTIQTALLDGATTNVNGQITFTAYTGSPCDNSTIVSSYTSTVSTSGSGTYQAPLPFTPLNAGTYYFVAAYSDDILPFQIKTNCGDASLVVQKVSPVLTLALSSLSTPPFSGATTASFAIQNSVTISSTLTNATDAASGVLTTQYYYSAVPTSSPCSNSPTLLNSASVVGNGTYSTTFTPLLAGTYYFTSFYVGDDNNNAASTNCGTYVLTVAPLTTTITTAISSLNVIAGTPVTQTATLTGMTYNAAGTITFRAYTSSNCTNQVSSYVPSVVAVNGSINTYTSATPFTTSTAGTYYFTASYSGDVNNVSATSSCGTVPLTVTSAILVTPSLTVSASPFFIPVNGSITIQARLRNGSPTISGSISIVAYGPSLLPSCTSGSPIAVGTIAVNGNATYTLNVPSFVARAGVYWIVGRYSGDGADRAVTSACGSTPLIVNKKKLTMVLTGNNNNEDQEEQNNNDCDSNSYWRLPPLTNFVQNTVLMANNSSSSSSALFPTGTLTVQITNANGKTIISTQTFNVQGSLPIVIPASMQTPSITKRSENFFILSKYSGDSVFLPVNGKILVKVVRNQNN